MRLSTGNPPTAAARLERELAREILRGERTPGSHLPPVRALADMHGVTAPTMHRVIERLAASGLVSVRRGSGVTVNDPHQKGDLSLLPMWFDAFADQPERAAGILADFLELRRVVAVHLIRTAVGRLAPSAPRLLALVEAMSADWPVEQIARADLEITRAVIGGFGQFAVAALFHTTETLVTAVPHVAEALYGDRAYHRRVIHRIARALGAGERAASEVERTLEVWDRRTAQRFRQRLEAAARV